MKYLTEVGFRTALEERLKQASRAPAGPSLMRLRKLVVFDRFMARLLVVAPDRWIVKGGVALDLRLGNRARTTKDLDVARQDSRELAHADLLDAMRTALGDYFRFTAEKMGELDRDNDVAVRYRVLCELAGRPFDTVAVDIGFGDPLPKAPDRLLGTDLLAFAGLTRIEVPALPLERHVAEKLHAYTRTYDGGRVSSRAKDLADLILIQSAATFEARRLREAIVDTFDTRGTHGLPAILPGPPANWRTPYRGLAKEVGLETDIVVGYHQAANFVDPVLSETMTSNARWDPIQRRWAQCDH